MNKIDRNAVFCDETELFKTPYEPKTGDVTKLKIRVKKGDAQRVYVTINGVRKTMKKSNMVGVFDEFCHTFVCPDKKVAYYFTVVGDGDKTFFNRLGCIESGAKDNAFSFLPNLSVPDWAKGRVFYQIYVDRFFNGNEKNDVLDNEFYYTGGHSKKVAWDKNPDALDVRCFYGGDLQGVEQKIDYLADLGIEGVYFNPLFVSPSNHKYDTQDYDYIDPHLAIIKDDEDHAMQDWEHHNGFARRYIKRITSKTNLEESNAYFAYLVKKLHEKGIKVIIDGVFNHCGSFNKWMDREGVYLNKKGYEKKGAYQSKKSPYRKYFAFKGNQTQGEYEGWWNYITLPKLNYEKSEKLKEEVLAIGEKWVSAPYDVDGWRLDVAADLGHSEKYNHKFWREFSNAVKEKKGDAFIFAEHYGDPSAWLENGEWDSVMNYDAFMEPVTWFLTGMEKHSEYFDGERYANGERFFEDMFKNMAKLPRPALDSAINQLSNHDHSRFLTRTNKTAGRLKYNGAESAGANVDKATFKLGVLMQMTWVGSPTLYYGDEAGQVGWTDPDCRRTYPWGKEDGDLLQYHKRAIALRKQINCLRRGSLKKLGAGDGYVIYSRFDGTDKCIVAINVGEQDIDVSVPAWQIGATKDERATCVFCTTDGEKGEKVFAKNGNIEITLKAKQGKVYLLGGEK